MMYEQEIKNYQALNELAEAGGIVIVGGTSDRLLPLCELKQAFALEANLYNRSFTNLSVKDAAGYYDACIEALYPETVLLHIGEADLGFFTEDPAAFDQKYRELIAHIRSRDRKCDIALISLKNPDEDTVTAEMNRHLKYISDSEHCAYGDITTRRVWNPRETRDVISFVYSTGFVRPLSNRCPLYDLVKLLFCFDPAYTG